VGLVIQDFFLRGCNKKLPCQFYDKDSGICRSHIDEKAVIKIEGVQLTDNVFCGRAIED